MDVAAILIRELAHETAVVLAVLFGSYAKGRARTESDIDIGIRWSADLPTGMRERVINRLERAVGGVVDSIDLSEASPLLRMEIARDGVVLVEREPGAWSDFRAHAMIDWWDFAPTARIMHGNGPIAEGEPSRGPR